eukprot:TRINITY_DN8453_c0_g1_i5.p1 TRINITY_DN8453_c0_g1~~TRINITY_DN8453_c0_g1_i5.p1  ORF type:complete len:256 (+),score=38.15 TRINITY_DN8453_c0_g1_i5:135-902(+)
MVATLEWLYLDSTGVEFGPFPGETMHEWLSQGYFPIGEELMVRLPEWPQHKPIKHIYPDARQAFLSPPGNIQPQPRQPAVRPSQGGGGQLLQGYAPMGGVPSPFPAQDMGGYGAVVLAQAGGASGGGSASNPAASQSRRGKPQAPAAPGTGGQRFNGRVKSYNAKQGFGFIECPEAHNTFGRDVFLHKAQVGDLKPKDEVFFSVEMNKSGFPQARDILTPDGRPPGPAPMNVAKGGTAKADKKKEPGPARGKAQV